MLSLLKWFLKTTIFTFVVLIAAQLIRWNGKTLSQHIHAGLNQSQKPGGIIHTSSTWSGRLVKDAQQSMGMQSTAPTATNDQIKSSAASAQKAKSTPPEIAESERDKLRSLIKELNTP